MMSDLFTVPKIGYKRGADFWSGGSLGSDREFIGLLLMSHPSLQSADYCMCSTIGQHSNEGETE